MKRLESSRRAGGFTLIELLCVIAIIGILAALLLPTLTKGKARAKQVQCVSELRQIGLAFHSFAHDHGGKFPMQVPSRDGGSLEFVENGYRVNGEFYFAFRHFQALGNELVTTKILICPTDTRLPAVNFSALKNENVSYFVSVKAEFGLPNSVLAGDRNITNDWLGRATILHVGEASQVRWTDELHRFRGNLLFADGRVEERNGARLALAGDRSLADGDVAVPSVKPSGASTPSGVLPSGPLGGVEPSRSQPTQPNLPNGRSARVALPPRPSFLPQASIASNQSRAQARSTNRVIQIQPIAAVIQTSNDFSFKASLGQAAPPRESSHWFLYLLLALLLAAAGLLEWRRRQRAKRKRLTGLPARFSDMNEDLHW